MTQIVPATCVLGPGKTGLTIGLRVLNLDGTVYAAFDTTGVAETSTAGTYRKAGGVVAPLAGGYIVWGEAATDYAETTVESTVGVLAADGLDAISTTAPTGVAADFREMMVQLWRRQFKRSTLTSTELKTYADDDVSVLTTQVVSDDGTVQILRSST